MISKDVDSWIKVDAPITCPRCSQLTKIRDTKIEFSDGSMHIGALVFCCGGASTVHIHSWGPSSDAAETIWSKRFGVELHGLPSLPRLRAMKIAWEGKAQDKVRVMNRLKSDLEALRETGQQADPRLVLSFLDTVRLAGVAAGKAELLAELVTALDQELGAPEDQEDYNGEFGL